MKLTSKKDIYTTIPDQETQNITEKIIEYLEIPFPMDFKFEPDYFCFDTKKKSFVVHLPYIDSSGTLKFDYIEEKTKITKYLRRKYVFTRGYLHFKDSRKPYLDFSLTVSPTVNLCENLPKLKLLGKKLFRSKKNGFRIFETVCKTLNISRKDIVFLEIPDLISYSKNQLNCVFEEHKDFSVHYQFGLLKYITDNAEVELSHKSKVVSTKLIDTTDVLENLSLKNLFEDAYRRTADLVEKVAEFNDKK